MTAGKFLGTWLALTLTIGYLGLVTLFCFLVPRIARRVMSQGESQANEKPGRSTD
jgi:hypothetical protein